MKDILIHVTSNIYSNYFLKIEYFIDELAIRKKYENFKSNLKVCHERHTLNIRQYADAV